MRSVAPVASASICQGTQFEWCSISVTRISSPAFTADRPQLCATRLMLSVVPRVKITSRGRAAPMNRATRSRASSYIAVASALSAYTPRWILAFSSA